MITTTQAKEIAIKWAELHRPSYYSEPFEPHPWVIDALLEAFVKGYGHAVEELKA